MNKIILVGCPASGKSTLATEIGNILDIKVNHLDQIFWVEKKGITQELFISQQEEMMLADKWIIDGNFMKSKSFDLRLEKADTIIFFEYPRRVLYFRLLKRRLMYLNKARPSTATRHKERLSWHMIKFIWNYPTEEIRAKVLAYANSKKVFILHNQKEKEEFVKNLVKQVSSAK